MKRNYELLVILPTTNHDEHKERFLAILTNNEITVLETKEWGRKRMFHPINKNQDGYFLLLQMEANVSNLQKLERDFRLDGSIMRYQILRKS